MAYNYLWDLFVVLIAYIYILLTIFIPLTLYKKEKISKFSARKSVHMFAGLAILSSPFYFWPFWPSIIAGTLTLFVYFSSKESKVKQLKDLYNAISEEQEQSLNRAFLQGPFFYCFSITFLEFIFAIIAPDNFYFPIAGVLIMIVADTLASVIGKRWGKMGISFSWTNSNRTLEGSATFFITALLVCFIAFYSFGLLIPTLQEPLAFATIIIYSLTTSTIATIIELISPSTYDDLTVPLGSTLIIYLLTLL
ncbi:MAG: diacylglycerol/polyprenol kinase family protein [Candidatus Thorarchaeota archaeon]